ncbi:ribonuclease P protein component [Flavobacterium sp.]|jgi:ribonuclease P protein component|uniref:ribonuclease P protein component n=1 Tax=Flavobacterium sp. TaxID=239 RepID=UPI003D2B2EAA
MPFTYPKNEKLKSKKTIELLFSEGQSVSKYPLRLVYVENSIENEELIKFGVSVSKKYFKNAVDRNRLKRILRECYRLNKDVFSESIDKPMAMMFFYQSKEVLSYQEINEKTIQLFQKFIEKIKE